MLTRMVWISWPHDPPISASQSAGITQIDYYSGILFLWNQSQESTQVILFHCCCFVFLRQSLTLLSKLEYSGVISTDHKLHLLGSSNSPDSLPSSCDYKYTLPCPDNFCILVDTNMGFCHILARLFLNSWPLMIHPPQPPKKCWNYRYEPLHPVLSHPC